MGTLIEARIPRGGSEYQLRRVTCGKPNCTRCPHGPYWYLVIRLRKGGSVKRYIGRNPPEDVTAAELLECGIDVKPIDFGVTRDELGAETDGAR